MVSQTAALAHSQRRIQDQLIPFMDAFTLDAQSHLAAALPRAPTPGSAESDAIRSYLTAFQRPHHVGQRKAQLDALPAMRAAPRVDATLLLREFGSWFDACVPADLGKYFPLLLSFLNESLRTVSERYMECTSWWAFEQLMDASGLALFQPIVAHGSELHDLLRCCVDKHLRLCAFQVGQAMLADIPLVCCTAWGWLNARGEEGTWLQLTISHTNLYCMLTAGCAGRRVSCHRRSIQPALGCRCSSTLCQRP
ncbi:MAG: hypothetical protein EOO65_00120 [Methanosarcinales archaeon]|nr:MAG: hypothetical protein EOO65_00120 [Methanosarcinales archaeon]